MKTKYLYMAQFFAWAGFTLIDLIDDKTSIIYYINKIIYYINKRTSNYVMNAMCFVIPIILAVLYFIEKKSSWNSRKGQSIIRKILRLVLLIVIWMIVTIAITIAISVLVENDLWIVHHSGLSLFSYLEFGFYLLVIPIVLVLLGELLILIVVKSIAYWKPRKI